MAIVSSTRLGPYEIQSRLGAGGMGEVYRARDSRLDRSTAAVAGPTIAATVTAPLTVYGTILGTLQYMATRRC